MSSAPPSSREQPSAERGGRGTRTELARAALTPLAPGERPPALLIAAAACALVALGVIAGALTVHDLSRHGGSLPGAVFLALVFGALALGMLRARYWAVLGFEAILAFQILFSALALTLASTLLAAGECVAGIALGGLLFYRLVRVMGRIQAGERVRRARE